MERRLIIFGFCVLLSVFSCVFADEANIYKVLQVVDGDMLYIDFNNNGKYDKGEKVRINGIDSFEVKKSARLDKQVKQYNLSETEVLSLGYLGKEFAKKNLLNKYVKVEYSAKTKTDRYNRPLVSVYYSCSKNGQCKKSYEQEVLKEGLAVVYPYSNLKKALKPYENIAKIRENVEKTNSLVILNLGNGKYHKLSCQYGQSAKNYKIIELKNLKKQTIEAKCCHNQYNQIQIPAKNPPQLKDNGTIKVYYIRARDYQKPSNDTRTEAGKELIKLINNAENSIDFAFYGLSHQDEIVNALVNAQKRGVKVRGIIDMTVFGNNHYPGTMEAVSKFYPNTIKNDYKTDLRKKELIDKKEIPYTDSYIFKGNIMHHKFCVIDNKITWLGSMNISPTGTGGYNENVVLIVDSSNLANFYTKEMNQMYNNELFHENKEEIYSTSPLLIGKIETDVYFSPSTHAVNEGILPELRKAKDYIYVSMFLISNRSIVRELINAKRRGVDVKMITEANHALQGYTKHEYLRKAGIPVKVENWGGKMHAKLAVIDDNTIITGSVNWTQSGFMYNDENMLILRNAQEQAKFLKNEFELSYKDIPQQWLFANPQPEGKDSPGTCFDGIDNNFDGLIDEKDPFCAGVKKNEEKNL